MIFLRRLVQLLVLLIHSGWWGVAPSPTEEGALRGGHGEHGEPGHQEPHKDSYSTFASEFLESRYLSDDGKLLVDLTGGFFLINISYASNKLTTGYKLIAFMLIG